MSRPQRLDDAVLSDLPEPRTLRLPVSSHTRSFSSSEPRRERRAGRGAGAAGAAKAAGGRLRGRRVWRCVAPRRVRARQALAGGDRLSGKWSRWRTTSPPDQRPPADLGPSFAQVRVGAPTIAAPLVNGCQRREEVRTNLGRTAEYPLDLLCNAIYASPGRRFKKTSQYLA